MSPSKLGARCLAVLATAAAGLGAGCYATTPHRAVVASSAPRRQCAAAIADVFERSGFVQLPTPPKMSMFFGPRMTGPYTSFLRTGAGVGVTVAPASEEGAACNVTIEALSPDADCIDVHAQLQCGGPGDAMDLVTGEHYPAAPQPNIGHVPCPIVRPLTCQLSYAPGADNDAAVDELARRVQSALGPASTVN